MVNKIIDGADGEMKYWERIDTGQRYNSVQDFPPGAMWYAPWLDEIYKPQLEHVLVVKLPNGWDWVIDSEASNCTKKGKKTERGEEIPMQKDHHCWVLHGIPPMVTVDKNGVTCDAGAGSIQGGDWHGFLRNGELVQ